MEIKHKGKTYEAETESVSVGDGMIRITAKGQPPISIPVVVKDGGKPIGKSIVENMKELMNDLVLKCSPMLQVKIRNVLEDLRDIAEQERAISDGLESLVDDYEILIEDILANCQDDSGMIKKLVDDFKKEHEG